MTILRSLDRIPPQFRRGAVAIGNFDGVHLGHARIMTRLKALAREVGGPAVVFTFDPHPVRLLRPHHAPPPLTWTDRKAELLAELGIDAVIAYPTDEAMLNLTAHEFFDDVVRGRLEALAMVEGANFFFGRDRLGDVDLLRHFCDGAGMKLEVVAPVEVDGQAVSSSRIRALVSQGRIDEVRHLLTRPYRIRGTVVRGACRGRTLGFPTANLEEVGTLLPAEGIYAGRVEVDGRPHPAAISLGPNPTFDEGRLKLEVHLLDYAGDLYGRMLEVDFLSRLRDIERFGSVDELLARIRLDLERTRRIADDPSLSPFRDA